MRTLVIEEKSITKEFKKCSNCNFILPVFAFNKDNSNYDKLQNYCKTCQSIKMKEWRQKNKNKHRKLCKDWFNEHPDYHKEYYHKNKEREKEKQKRFKRRHPERAREIQRDYWRRNPHKKAEKDRRRRERIKGNGKELSTKEWEYLKFKYNFTCLYCGRQEPKIKLQPDHIIPLAKDGSNNLSNRQPLCLSCNSSKGTKIIDYRK